MGCGTGAGRKAAPWHCKAAGPALLGLPLSPACSFAHRHDYTDVGITRCPLSSLPRALPTALALAPAFPSWTAFARCAGTPCPVTPPHGCIPHLCRRRRCRSLRPLPVLPVMPRQSCNTTPMAVTRSAIKRGKAAGTGPGHLQHLDPPHSKAQVGAGCRGSDWAAAAVSVMAAHPTLSSHPAGLLALEGAA